MEERDDDSNRQPTRRGVETSDENLSSIASPAETTIQAEPLDPGFLSAVGVRPSDQQESNVGAAVGAGVSAFHPFVQESLQPASNTYSLGTGSQPYSAHTSMDFLSQRGSFVPQSSSQYASLMPSASTTSHASSAAFTESQSQMLIAEGPVDNSVARMPAETDTTDAPVIHYTAAIDPHENDVLYGRGKQHRNRPGNKRMKLLVDLHRDAYNKANRIAKTNMSNEIVNIIKFGGEKSGRFLRFEKKVNGWVEVSDESAREKISHAMRDGKTRPLERIDPKVLDEMPLLSDQIRQEALLKIAESKPAGETSLQPIPAPSEEEADPPVDHTASTDERKQDDSEKGADRRLA